MYNNKGKVMKWWKFAKIQKLWDFMPMCLHDARNTVQYFQIYTIFVLYWHSQN
jgi:hypothetical protein